MLLFCLLPTVNHVGFMVMPCTTGVHGKPCTLRGAWLPTVYCLLLLLATPAFPETTGWAATYGGFNCDRAYSIHETSDDGYIVVGETRSFSIGRIDIWVLKLRPDGTVEWQKTYGENNADEAHSIQQTSDGGYIVASWTLSFNKGDFWVLKLRPDGSIDPACDLVRDTNISDRDSTAQARNTRTARESNANPKDSSATVRDTDVPANFLYPSTTIKD